MGYSLGEKKNIGIHYLTSQNGGLFALKKYLAGYHDRQPAVRYFQPCIKLQFKLQFILLNSYL